MRTITTVIAGLLVASAARAAEFAAPQPGQYADYEVTLTEATESGGEARTLTGKADARVYCVERDADGAHFVLTFRVEGTGAGSSLKNSLAYIVLDPAGRVLPDLAAGMKISLDRASWTAAGLIPRLPSDLLANPDRRIEDVDLQIYGEAQRLPMIESLARRGAELTFDRRPAQASPRLKIGRQAQPKLREYFDHWTLDAAGRPADWRHRTSILYELPDKPAMAVVVDMTARRTGEGTLTDAELAQFRKDAARLKPAWTPLVNPEPGDLGKLDVDGLAAGVEEFLRERPDSRLAASAEVLKESMGDLRKMKESQGEEDKQAANLIGRPAPDFTLNGLDGRPHKLSDYRGQVVMLVFWGHGCRLCRKEAPVLTELYEKYKDKGFTVLAVEAFDTDAADVKALLLENKLRHPVLLKGSEVGVRQYAIGGFPRAFWIDHQGNVVGRQLGFSSKDALEAKIRDLLAQRGER